MRVPEQNWGDLKAQIAAMNTGERKVHEMIRKFGIATFRQGIQDLLDYAEQQARNVIAGIPDGEYFFSDYADEDSVGGKPCRIALKLTIHGDSLTLDFTGSDPQLESSLNMPTGGDVRHVLIMVGLVYALYSLDTTILLNAGLARPATGILPEGTIVNPKFPAAVGMRSLTCMRLQGVIFGAFSQIAPDRMPACPASGGPIMNVNTIDNATGRRVVASIDPIFGGAGGNPREDGADGSGANSSFLKNTPVEINEVEVPIKVLSYGLARDSGGAGLHRGGLGTLLEFKVFSPGTRITARNRDRSRFTAWGVLGGHAGGPSEFLLNPGSNHEVDLGNTDILKAGPGDVIRIASSGAGGWGSPLARPAAEVLADVRRGFVSLAAAETEYGVVIANDRVEEAATAALREKLCPLEPKGHFDYGAARVAFEKLWTAANYEALTRILAALPVHWRYFIKHRIFERLAELPPECCRGDGSEVVEAWEAIAREFPQVRTGARPAAE